MDLEYLFESALVALGPPMQMPYDPRDKKNFATSEFNDSVGKYYELLSALRVVTDEACSYEKFSEWFHERR